MSKENAFSESQKQYLSGLTFGADVARAVRRLPVLSDSASDCGAVNGSVVSVGAKTTSVQPPPIAEQHAIDAQCRTIESGGKLSNEEKAKSSKNALDMWDEMQSRSDAGTFPSGPDVFLQKFHGLFYVAPAQDSYMCRMRIPGGQLRSWQFRGIADLADASASGAIDVTTRANLQYREIPADQAMNILFGLRELDVVCKGSGGDNIRNCTASCLSGIDPTEIVETIPLAKRMHHYILNHREMYGLPRKFNIAFDGGGKMASLDDTNDIGFRAVTVDEANADATTPAGVYFQLTLGGITGHKDFARYTGVLLTAAECLDVAGAVIRVFVKNGDRTDRKKARLKYVLDDWGFEKFITAIEESLGRELRKVDASRLSVPDNEDRFSHIGFHPQKQDGMNYVGVVLPVGRIQSDQARALSDLADEFGNGEIRLTVWQNLVIPNIDDANIPAVKRRLEQMGLGYEASSFRAGLVACTGSAGCKFAGADTKTQAMQIAAALESQIELDQPINIHVTGCHHSCAQHYIGDIGLQGCQVEQGDDMVDGYHVYLGGGWGNRQAIARQLFSSVAFDDLLPLLTAIIAGYMENRIEGETFVDFVGRSTDDQLKSLAMVNA